MGPIGHSQVFDGGLYSRFNNECKDALDEIHYEIKSE